MAVSDVLFEAEQDIREYQKDGIIAKPGDPELELLIALMRAVRFMPGRDTPPFAPSTFAADLDAALVAYRASIAARCTHNAMVPNDDPLFAWRCADCGHTYGQA